MITSFNQQIIHSASVSIDHLGFLRGYGVFETMRTYNQRIFRLNDHLDRLFQSAKKINLKSPWSRTQIKQSIEKLHQSKTLISEQRFRLILADQDMIIQMMDVEEKPASFYEEGVLLVAYEGLRSFPAAKIIGCLTCYLANEHAKRNNAYDSILIHPYNRQITECSYANLFWVKEGQLFTTDKDILEGVTRKVVMELAESYKFESIDLDGLKKADEIFITQTSSGILPVNKLDDQTFEVGRVTKDLMGKFNNLVWSK